MAKKFRQIKKFDSMMKSGAMEAILKEHAAPILAAAQSDPNPTYVASLDMHSFMSKSRVSVQVGAAPIIGAAVEAKRGTLARAVGSAGG